jgi:hypothetical protein
VLELAIYINVYITIVTRYLVLSFALSVFISGCMVTPPVKRPAVDSTKVKIQQLLFSADTAMEENRLTTPADDSAFDRYKQVLNLDPSNKLAIDGINRIVERYLAWALDHAERSNLNRARRFVSLAEGIDPAHPNIQPVVNKINDQEDKVVSVFKLDATAVRNQSVDPARLETIAARIQRHHAFITIRAPDDRSGRWLYQELNRRVDFRIEASFERSSNASVSLTL